MQYRFNDFILDSKQLSLQHKTDTIKLTKGQYHLLLTFIQNPQKLLSFDTLINKAWSGKSVTDNTVSKSINRLNQLLEKIHPCDYIQNNYSQGFIFLPNVRKEDYKSPLNENHDSVLVKKKWLIFVTGFLMLSFLYPYFITHNNSSNLEQPIIMILNDDSAVDYDIKYASGQSLLIEQLLSLSSSLMIKKSEDKPQQLNTESYLKKQIEIVDNLNILTTRLIEKDKTFILTFILKNQNSEEISRSFTGENFTQAFKKANHWLHKQLKLKENTQYSYQLIPQNVHVLNLYLQGLNSVNQGDFTKAEQLFSLSIAEDSNFHLARFELAKVKFKQGKNKESLALLDTLNQTIENPELIIKVGVFRANILYFQRELKEARDILLALIENYEGTLRPHLFYVRHQLSWVYSLMGSNGLALIELENLETQLTENKNAELLSDVYMKKASISFNERIKNVPEKYVKKAADLYQRLGDNHGVGRTTALLGRILEKSAKYDEAILILEKSLKLFQKRNSLHGIAGIAKRMVSILIKQGKLDQAWELNQLSAEKAAQMKHHDLIRIAKEHAIIIETKKGNWQLAQILLSQYNADTLDHEKNLKQVYSQFMQLDLFMAQNKTDESLSVISDIQDIINKKNYTGLQNKLNFALASYYSMIMQPDQGITLLNSTKQKINQSDNVEDIIELNNTLAKLYLQNNQASQALSILQEIAQYNPVAYPYLLFKSQAHFVLQNPVKALELAKECKANAFNLWNPKDQKYLNKLSVN